MPKADLIWWCSTILVSAINLVIAFFMFAKLSKLKKMAPENTKYFKLLQTLGITFILVAMYRTVFVSSYPQRLAWVDLILNSPFIIRSLAFFAELSFNGIIALILFRLHKDMNLNRSRLYSLTSISPYVAFGCIFIAQFFAYAGLITQHNIWFAIEETLWVVSFLFVAPLVFLGLKQMKRKPELKGYKLFLTVLAIWCVGYICFQCYTLPFMHYPAIALDAGKAIPPDALRQSIFNYTFTRDFSAYGGIGFFVWHSGYFSICSWMVLVFMSAPRKRALGA